MSVANRQRRLAIALSLGCVFAFLTWIGLEPACRPLQERFNYVFGPIAYFVVPGILASGLVGGISILYIWLAAAANFAFYFGLVYLAFAIWPRHVPNSKRNY